MNDSSLITHHSSLAASANGDACPECSDTGIAMQLYGPSECKVCAYKERPFNPTARRIHDCVLELIARGTKIDAQLWEVARALAHSSFDAPVPGEKLQAKLGIDRRTLSDRMKRLRDEWFLPALATRQKPTGYYVATRPEHFELWRRHTYGQAMSELVTLYRLQRSNFPELAGQQTLDFVNAVSQDLREAVGSEQWAVVGKNDDADRGSSPTVKEGSKAA